MRVLLRAYDEKMVCLDEARKLDTKKYYLRFSCVHENNILCTELKYLHSFPVPDDIFTF